MTSPLVLNQTIRSESFDPTCRLPKLVESRNVIFDISVSNEISKYSITLITVANYSSYCRIELSKFQSVEKYMSCSHTHIYNFIPKSFNRSTVLKQILCLYVYLSIIFSIGIWYLLFFFFYVGKLIEQNNLNDWN